jgi:hypothetical protein
MLDGQTLRSGFLLMLCGGTGGQSRTPGGSLRCNGNGLRVRQSIHCSGCRGSGTHVVRTLLRGMTFFDGEKTFDCVPE